MEELNEEMSGVEDEIAAIRSRLRESIPDLFGFDVVVGNVQYDANTNTVSAVVEPGSEAQEQLSQTFGGVQAKAGGTVEFEFGAIHEQAVDPLEPTRRARSRVARPPTRVSTRSPAPRGR